MTLAPSRFDHALLSPELRDDEIARGAARCAEHGIRGVCVLPRSVPSAAPALAGSATLLVAVVNFPAGGSVEAVAVAEASRAASEGAREIDVVVPTGWLRAGDLERAAVYLVRIVGAAGVPVKAIVEAAWFNDGELASIAREVAQAAGVAFFKTGTGVYGGPLPVERIRTLRAALPAPLRLKVSGGVRDAAAAIASLEAGADVLGTSRTFAILGLE